MPLSTRHPAERRDPRRWCRVVVCLGLLGAARAEALDREDDPVVLTGSMVPSLQSVEPGRIVAFRSAGGAWVQLPVQVDQRAWVDLATVYNDPPNGQLVLTYTDSATFTGPDPDPTFDADDELVLMARDAGTERGQAPGPPGTLAGSGVEVEWTDPLGGGRGWLYLFESDGSLDPAAGVDRVRYTFNLLSGDYKTTYGLFAGPNPEDSRIETDAFEVHFSDRWVRDGTAVFRDGATGEDILDRHKAAFAPGVCARTEDTFSAGGGAFIANLDGPLRAVRGYIGANSGPFTHRIHRFYESREEIYTSLRVHNIPGVADFFDYAPSASGMTYTNDLNATAVRIDGAQDSIAAGQISWELVTGSQGTLAHSFRLETDIPDPDYTSYYSDRIQPIVDVCTGDDFEYGASGVWKDEDIPNTDQEWPPFYVFELTRYIKYGPPDRPRDFGSTAAAEVDNPLAIVTRPLSPSTACADSDGDGYAVCDGSCDPPAGAGCGDCDDADQALNPGQPEICDGADNDCDPSTPDGMDELWWETPCDGPDGDACEEGVKDCTAGQQACSDDTDDSLEDAAAAGTCTDGLDNDCDGLTDDADGACDSVCPDSDHDGYSSCDGACTPDAGQTCGDCDDFDDTAFPGAPELCDGSDNDCDASLDEALCDEFDADGDGNVDGVELAWLGRAFGLCSPTPTAEWWDPVDYDRDGCVTGDDLAILATVWNCESGAAVCP